MLKDAFNTMTRHRFVSLLCFFLLLLFSARAQDMEKKLDSLQAIFVDSLHKEKIDTICIYQNYFLGGYVKREKGKCPYNPSYIIWKKKNKTLFTKLDVCFKYAVVEVQADSIWNIYFENEDSIKKEVVLPFQYKLGKGYGQLIWDHQIHRSYQMMVGSEVVTQSISETNLFETHENNSNMNFEHNINLKSKKMMDMLDRLIESKKVKKK